MQIFSMPKFDNANIFHAKMCRCELQAGGINHQAYVRDSSVWFNQGTNTAHSLVL